MDASGIFELIMLICLGIMWPIELVKAYKGRTSKGKSIVFLSLIATGYTAGIISKFTLSDFGGYMQKNWLVFALYAISLILVGLNIAVYFRNRKLDKQYGRV